MEDVDFKTLYHTRMAAFAADIVRKNVGADLLKRMTGKRLRLGWLRGTAASLYLGADRVLRVA